MTAAHSPDVLLLCFLLLLSHGNKGIDERFHGIKRLFKDFLKSQIFSQ